MLTAVDTLDIVPFFTIEYSTFFFSKYKEFRSDDAIKIILVGFFQLFGTTYLQKIHMHKIAALEYQTAEIWAFEVHISP